ncbi:hypothetical protein BESB_036590 [Besnoitia besnoiti]|uniref:Uncharacterized protein n=1 Tax=Besnoitia besnoiti TaxID=94643 RepID=A0A2A9MLJ1_BESBE|nr:hypothetical protein BESB_036590 [Besnoitia besnoiti]PFH37201.1 hypothetical protein BESB_036590 [Besnoitia besnoiti]
MQRPCPSFSDHPPGAPAAAAPISFALPTHSDNIGTTAMAPTLLPSAHQGYVPTLRGSVIHRAPARPTVAETGTAFERNIAAQAAKVAPTPPHAELETQGPIPKPDEARAEARRSPRLLPVWGQQPVESADDGQRTATCSYWQRDSQLSLPLKKRKKYTAYFVDTDEHASPPPTTASRPATNATASRTTLP